MLIKTLVTGFVTSAAAVGMVTAAAAGVSSVTASSAPAITPVVWDTPLPQLPAPDLQAPLTQTLSALAGPGSFSGKAPYIQGGIGRIESIAADRAYNNAAREGKFPLTFNHRGHRRYGYPAGDLHRRTEPHRLAGQQAVGTGIALGGRVTLRRCPSP